MLEHKHQYRVTYKETDQMGVVYYANYLHWFEMGRNEFLREEGWTYKRLENQGVLLPVSESHCKYHSPAHYDDIIEIRTGIENLRRTRIVFDYEIVRVEDDRLLATGSTVHPFVNNNFKPISLKKKEPELWKLVNDDFDK